MAELGIGAMRLEVALRKASASNDPLEGGWPHRLGSLDIGVTAEEPETQEVLTSWGGVDGREFFDEISGARLDPEGVASAREARA